MLGRAKKFFRLPGDSVEGSSWWLWAPFLLAGKFP